MNPEWMYCGSVEKKISIVLESLEQQKYHSFCSIYVRILVAIIVNLLRGLSWTILLNLKIQKWFNESKYFPPLCWLLIWVFFVFFVRISEIEWKYKNTLVLASFLLIASHTIWPTHALLLLVPLHFNDIYLTFCSVYPWLYYYYYYSFLLFLVPGLPQSFCILLDHHHHSC